MTIEINTLHRPVVWVGNVLFGHAAITQCLTNKAKLAATFVHHRIRRTPYSIHSQRTEQEREHRTNEHTSKKLRVRKGHIIECKNILDLTTLG